MLCSYVILLAESDEPSPPPSPLSESPLSSTIPSNTTSLTSLNSRGSLSRMPSDDVGPPWFSPCPKSPTKSSTIDANSKSAAVAPVSFLTSNPANRYGSTSSPSGTFQVPVSSPSSSPSKEKRVLRIPPRVGSRSDTSAGASGQSSKFGSLISQADIFSSAPLKPIHQEPASSPPRSQPTTTSAPQASSPDTNVTRFLEIPLGADLQPYVIAHDVRAQALFDSLQIEWGVQFELARGIILGSRNHYWTWEEVIEKIGQLRGTNETAAPRVPSVMKPGEKASSGTDPKVW